MNTPYESKPTTHPRDPVHLVLFVLLAPAVLGGLYLVGVTGGWWQVAVIGAAGGGVLALLVTAGLVIRWQASRDDTGPADTGQADGKFHR